MWLKIRLSTKFNGPAGLTQQPFDVVAPLWAIDAALARLKKLMPSSKDSILFRL